VAATNCLNFGNPEKPEIMAQLSAAIDGIAEACMALDVPITGGNVSLYNETKGEGIYPTPVVGVVGILDDVSKAVPSGFQKEGDDVLSIYCKALSGQELAIGSTAYAKEILGETWGTPPRLDIALEAALHRLLGELAEQRLLHSASDISDGGFAVAISKAAISSGIGFRGRKFPSYSGDDMFLEAATEVIVTCAPSDSEQVQRIVSTYGLSSYDVGTTGGDRVTINLAQSEKDVDASIRELRAAFSSTLESQLAAEVVTG
jgi:phosphoribosylformylglycinamidine (FGAM) synthase-like enzyme